MAAGRKIFSQKVYSCYVIPFLILILSTFIPAIVGATSKTGGKTKNMPEPLNAFLEPYRTQHELPALGVAVVKNGKIIAIGTVGTRAAGMSIPVTVNDRFHLGSDTKAMTALLAAMYVEEGKLRWNSTVEDIFPELKNNITPGLRRVTLEQLLSHTSGMPGDNERFGELIGESSTRENDNLKDLRYWILSKWVTEPLASEPGTRFAYSNMGYVIAGAMVERVSGKSWEELMVEKIFMPFGFRKAGLGVQSSVGKIDAPLSHKILDEKQKPMLAGPNADNPQVIGPAGNAHMSLADFATWAGWNAGQGKRPPRLVRPETLKKLHVSIIDIPEKKDAAPGTPSHGRYGLGWGEVTFDWSKKPFLYHGGSNGMNLAHILLRPDKDFAIVLMTNIGGRKANQAFFAIEKALCQKFLGEEIGN